MLTVVGERLPGRYSFAIGRCLRVIDWSCVGACGFCLCLCRGVVVGVCVCCPLGCVCGRTWHVPFVGDGFGSGGFRLGEKRGEKKKQEGGKRQPENKR